MKTKFNKADWYILLWCIILFLGIIRMFDVLSVILLFIAFFISIYYFIKIFNKTSNAYIKALGLLIFFFTLYGLVYIMAGSPYFLGSGYLNKRVYLINIYKSLIPFFPIYYYTTNNLINEKKIKLWSIILIVLAIASYYKHQTEALDALWAEGNTRNEVTNNAGYIVLSLIPIVLIFKNKIIQYALLSLFTILIFISFKRGAILLGTMCLIFYLYYELRNNNIRNRLIIVFVSFIGGYFVYEYLMAFIENSPYFYMRLNDTLNGSSSGRDDLASSLLDYYINDASIVEQVIGSGADATIGVARNYAHNDWLEILINQGAVGVFVYLYYWLSFWKSSRTLRCYGVSYLVMMLYGIITFGKTLFSMSYFDTPFYLTVIFAYFFAARRI